MRIFYDAWIPNENGRITSPWNYLASEASVDLLISQDIGWWNTHLIDLCFYPLEAKQLNLSLCALLLNPIS